MMNDLSHISDFYSDACTAAFADSEDKDSTDLESYTSGTRTESWSCCDHLHLSDVRLQSGLQQPRILVHVSSWAHEVRKYMWLMKNCAAVCKELGLFVMDSFLQDKCSLVVQQQVYEC